VDTEILVDELPLCDFCKQEGRRREARVDGKTVFGSWAYMCEYHFVIYGVGLGTGLGQKLIKKEEK
jgi:hypothetical protein